MHREILEKKDKGKDLEKEEIESVIKSFNEGRLTDEEMEAFLRSIYEQGLSYDETKYLTMAEVATGTTIEWPDNAGVIIDKHSTGGVGDKVSLIVVPWVASLGVKVAKLSGRALGHTGGTIDKLLSIPGFKVNLTIEKFVDQVMNIGCAIAEPFEELCPVEKKIYSLRHKTGMISSIPLITASILSKKIAAGTERFVFDVKKGHGAFMRTMENALLLADYLNEVSKRLGKKSVCVITSMDEPLGRAIGNSLEVVEAIDFLSGHYIPDLHETAGEIAKMMMVAAGYKENEAQIALESSLKSGKALAKLLELISAQGGPGNREEIKRDIPRAKIIGDFNASNSGYILMVNPISIAEAASAASGYSEYSPDAGIVLQKKVGDFVKEGETLAEIHASSYETLDEAADILEAAFIVVSEKIKPSSKIIKVIT